MISRNAPPPRPIYHTPQLRSDVHPRLPPPRLDVAREFVLCVSADGALQSSAIPHHVARHSIYDGWLCNLIDYATEQPRIQVSPEGHGRHHFAISFWTTGCVFHLSTSSLPVLRPIAPLAASRSPGYANDTTAVAPRRNQRPTRNIGIAVKRRLHLLVRLSRILQSRGRQALPRSPDWQPSTTTDAPRSRFPFGEGWSRLSHSQTLSLPHGLLRSPCL